MTQNQADRAAKAIETLAAISGQSSNAVFESLCDSGIFHKDDDCDMIEESLEDS
jgi:hypothetical protein